MFEPKKIEAKWRGEWSKARLFEADVSNKKKFFITFPYPYVNGAPHVGHSYSFFRADVFARFKRMQGFNVLFPQAFHATGEPILGTVERLNQGDKKQVQAFKDFGAEDKDVEEFKKGPEQVAEFWKKRWTADLSAAGMSIDWRRSFITTDLTPAYSRFIEWQYNTLRRKGFVVQGTHPVVYCPHCKSPTGDHDRLEGEGESPVEYTLLKFPLQDDPKTFLVAGTLRPETVYGVTNMWVNPDTEYVKAKLQDRDEHWVLSREALAKLQDQHIDLSEEGRVSGRELVGKTLVNPVTRHPHPVLPAVFVEAGNASGLVTSVPSDAPYDYIALQDLKKDGKTLKEFGIGRQVQGIKPIPIIKTPGYGEFPAAEACRKYGVTSQKDAAKLEKADSDTYKHGFHEGIMSERCQEYAARKVSEVKEELITKFHDEGIASSIWETTDKVVCRCTSVCHVKILENQWFLKFSDGEWKEMARKCLKRMRVFPEEARIQFENTIEWLQNKACARRSGLGTKIPWDKDWIVETLGDSTIYMAYYAISRIINEKKIMAGQLPDELFDYIFTGKGQIEEVVKKAKLERKTVEEMKKEFEYFYPMDLRSSGKDLLQNHLTFMLFHHTAIFGEKHWPRGIAVNGYVNVEGEKMSKSKGNFIPFLQLLQQYGADLCRINVCASGEGMADADWRNETIATYGRLLDCLYNQVDSLDGLSSNNFGREEKLLESKLARSTKRAAENYELLKFRTACQHALFNPLEAIRKYVARTGKDSNKSVMEAALKRTVLLAAPLVPHFAEEAWRKLGNKEFAAISRFPSLDETKIDEDLEHSEEYLHRLVSDVQNIQKFKKISTKKLTLFVSPEWKLSLLQNAVEDARQTGRFDFKAVLQQAKRDGRFKGREKQLADFLKSIIKAVNYYKESELPKIDELGLLNSERRQLEKTLGCPVQVFEAGQATKQNDPQNKAAKAAPFKPAIFLE